MLAAARLFPTADGSPRGDAESEHIELGMAERLDEKRFQVQTPWYSELALCINLYCVLIAKILNPFLQEAERARVEMMNEMDEENGNEVFMDGETYRFVQYRYLC